MKDATFLENSNPHQHDNLRDSDVLESMQSGARDLPDSPTSAVDAGLLVVSRDSDSDIDSEFDLAAEPREIPMSDVEQDAPQLEMNEMSDMDAPGEIDIDGLDEKAVEALLPPDARLDPLYD